MRGSVVLLAATALAIAVPASAQAPVAYIDAHSHLAGALTPEQTVAAFRKAGLAGVVLMSADPDVLASVSKANPGYIAGGVMVSRLQSEKGLRLDPGAGAAFAKAVDTGQACQFGEIPTRIEGAPEKTDAEAISNASRRAIFDAANARGIPVTVHVSLETPEVIAAVEQAAAAHPRMKLILAHAGWVAGPDVVGKLMAAHPNIYADLSIRILPRRTGGGQAAMLSILTPEGVLEPAWSDLIKRFPDRFLFGMDLSGQDAYARIEQTFAVGRAALAPLPRAVQEQVAHGNIQRLLNGCGIVR